MTCYQALLALPDDNTAVQRAQPILVAAYELLQKEATNIKDEALRQKFLQNVSFNREIQAIWEGQGESMENSSQRNRL